MAFGGFAQQGFEFGKDVFDWIEVRRKGRQEDDLRAARGDGFTHPGHFGLLRLSATTISPGCRVEPNTSRTYCRKASPFIGLSKSQAASTPVRAQGGDEDVGVPVAMRRLVQAALAPGRLAVAPGQARGHAGLIKKNELVAALLLLSFSLLLAGVQSFFKSQTPPVELMPKGRNLELDILLLAQALTQIGQTQIPLLCDPHSHLLLHWSQALNAVAADRSSAAFTMGLEATFDLVDPGAERYRLVVRRAPKRTAPGQVKPVNKLPSCSSR